MYNLNKVTDLQLAQAMIDLSWFGRIIVNAPGMFQLLQLGYYNSQMLFEECQDELNSRE